VSWYIGPGILQDPAFVVMFHVCVDIHVESRSENTRTFEFDHFHLCQAHAPHLVLDSGFSVAEKSCYFRLYNKFYQITQEIYFIGNLTKYSVYSLNF
jgi:hypothetical protein